MRDKKYLPIGTPKFKAYHESYDQYRLESKILNGGAETVPNLHTVFWDKSNIQNELVQIVGDEKGLYWRENQAHVAFIPYLKMRLTEIADDWKRYQQKRINEGYDLPTTEPKEIFESRLRYEAKLAILEEEKKELQKRLKEIVDRDEKEDESKILQYGLKQSGRLQDGILVELDGQKVIEHQGQLIIGNGPYSGLKVTEYRKLARVWLELRNQLEAGRLKQFQNKCREEGKPIPQSLPFRGGQKIDKSTLPAWPAWAKDQLKSSNAETKIAEQKK